MQSREVNCFAVAVAFFWGWSEAVWFFVIPDVWLTFCVFWGWRTAVSCTLSATAGAILGAVTIYALPAAGLAALHHWWTLCPGYYSSMFGWIGEQFLRGPSGLLAGPVQGVPYRFFVYSATQSNISLGAILAWTPIARLPRMVLGPAIAGPLLWLVSKQNRDLELRLPVGRIVAILFLTIWAIIYFDYWVLYLPDRFGSR